MFLVNLFFPAGRLHKVWFTASLVHTLKSTTEGYIHYCCTFVILTDMCPPGNSQTPNYTQTGNYTVSSISLTSSPVTTAITSKTTNSENKAPDAVTSSTKCKGNVVVILHPPLPVWSKNKNKHNSGIIWKLCVRSEPQLDHTEGRDHQGDSVTERVANNSLCCGSKAALLSVCRSL